MIRFLRQAAIIFGFTLAGELLHLLLPLPIPTAIYGLILLFLALCLKIVKVEQIKEVSSFLIMFMSVLFIPPVVNLIEYWQILAPNIIPVSVIIVGSTVLVFAVAGLVTGLFLRGKEDK